MQFMKTAIPELARGVSNSLLLWAQAPPPCLSCAPVMHCDCPPVEPTQLKKVFHERANPTELTGLSPPSWQVCCWAISWLVEYQRRGALVGFRVFNQRRRSQLNTFKWRTKYPRKILLRSPVVNRLRFGSAKLPLFNSSHGGRCCCGSPSRPS